MFVPDEDCEWEIPVRGHNESHIPLGRVVTYIPEALSVRWAGSGGWGIGGTDSAYSDNDWPPLTAFSATAK